MTDVASKSNAASVASADVPVKPRVKLPPMARTLICWISATDGMSSPVRRSPVRVMTLAFTSRLSFRFNWSPASSPISITSMPVIWSRIPRSEPTFTMSSPLPVVMKVWPEIDLTLTVSLLVTASKPVPVSIRVLPSCVDSTVSVSPLRPRRMSSTSIPL